MTSQAPAKIILFGEHAVVYGYPAVAVPFGTITARIESHPAPIGAGLTVRSRETGQEFRVRSGEETFGGALAFAVQLALIELGIPPPDLQLDLQSSIPIGGGFGSGAAVATVVIREIGEVMARPFSPETVNRLVYEVEKMFHGTPSGIDNTTIVYNRPVYFVRGQPPEPFNIGSPLMLVVADSGVRGSTKETVADVRRYREDNPIAAAPMFDRIGALVEQAKTWIEGGQIDKIGALMIENHGILRALTVSSALLDRLVTAALSAGALGAKLSGGGRGGNVIALVRPDMAVEIAAAFRGAGAVKTWITRVG